MKILNSMVSPFKVALALPFRADPKAEKNHCQLTESRGFTLIEAMIVVVILGILTALAYPSYIDQVRKARRADAESSLLAAAQILERCFTRLNTYVVDDGSGNGCPNPTGISQDGYYDISLDEEASGVTSFRLIAEPLGDQQKDPCGEYMLDHLGNKSPVPDANRCWGNS